MYGIFIKVRNNTEISIMTTHIDYHFACSTCGQEYMGTYLFSSDSILGFPAEEVEEIHEPDECGRCNTKTDILFRYDPQTLVTEFIVENAIYSNEPLFDYSKSHINSLYSLNELKCYDAPNSDFINRLFFSHYVTIMEAYLSDLFKFFVNNSFDCFLKYLDSAQQLKNEKFTLSEYIRNPSIALEKVNERLDSILFHNLKVVDSLFKGIFNTSLNNIIGTDKREKLEKLVEYRHDLVHRNGKTTSGEPLEVTNEINFKIYELINNLINSIHNFIIGKEITVDRNKVYVWRYMDSMNKI